MIEAGLHAAMDETWCTVVPPEVAVARIMERNALTSASRMWCLTCVMLSPDGPVTSTPDACAAQASRLSGASRRR
jgi:hypothetical protein